MSDETSGGCAAVAVKSNTPATYDFEDNKQSNPVIIVTVPNSIFKSETRFNPPEGSLADLIRKSYGDSNIEQPWDEKSRNFEPWDEKPHNEIYGDV